MLRLPVLLFLVAFWAKSITGQAAVSTPAASPHPSFMKRLWTLNGRYVDAKHGVSFRYPSAWSAGVQFGYWPPSLTTSENGKPIAGFGYETGGFPRSDTAGPYAQTTLEGFGIVYTALPASSAATCEAHASAIATSALATPAHFGGRRFSARETGAGGMSQSSSGTLYSTYTNATCYLFEINETAVGEQVADDVDAEEQAGENAPAIFLTGISNAQSRTIDDGLLNIMRSVRIQTR